MATTKSINSFDPEVVIPKIKNLRGKVAEFISAHKKMTAGIIILALLAGFVFVMVRRNAKSVNTAAAKSVKVRVDKSFTFNALTGQGRISGTKIQFKVADVEKTDQVLVKDQTYTAKNGKMFLIFNLELKNDDASLQNIIPGDLVRLAVSGNEDTRYAPDLHNSLVGVAAISTKTDRIGFVIPGEANHFKLYVGELEGKKEEIKIDFPS